MDSRQVQISEHYFHLPEKTAAEHVAKNLSGHFGVIMPQRHTVHRKSLCNLCQSSVWAHEVHFM